MFYETTVLSRDHRYYQLALKVAEDCGPEIKDKHGAVIVKGNKILALGTNRMCTHPESDKWKKKTLHAEQRVLIRLGAGAKGATLYSARFHEQSISKPCEMCSELLREAGIHKVVYSDGRNIRSVKISSS